jgi:hypothetical protein
MQVSLQPLEVGSKIVWKKSFFAFLPGLSAAAIVRSDLSVIFRQ